ncbi:MAG: ATP synthase subunit I [Oscillospiraceae bacterium]
MYHNRGAIRQLVGVLICEIVCVGLMFGVYALIGRLSRQVLLGGALGGVLAVLNFFMLSVTVSRAADRAESTGETGKAKLSVQSSSVIRLLILAVIYIIVLKAGMCDPVASILPLLFVQLSITILEFFRRDGGKQK